MNLERKKNSKNLILNIKYSILYTNNKGNIFNYIIESFLFFIQILKIDISNSYIYILKFIIFRTKINNQSSII